MINDHLPLVESIALPEMAAHIRICSAGTMLKHVCTEEMRQWYDWMPNVLFRFGRFRFPGESARVYEGGLTTEKNLFLLVPHVLYQQHRRALLIQLAREHLGITNPTALRAYCRRAEQELTVSAELYLCDDTVLDVERRVRQVSYWARFLAYRQEIVSSSWRW